MVDRDLGQVLDVREVTLFFCLFNLVYIPAAFWAMKTGNVHGGWPLVGRGFYAPDFKFERGARPRRAAHAHHGQHRHDHHALADLLPAVGRGGQGHGHQGHQVRQDRHACSGRSSPASSRRSSSSPRRRCSTTTRADRSCVESAAETAAKMPEMVPAERWGEWAKGLFAIGLFDAGLLGALASRSRRPGRSARCSAGRTRSTRACARRPGSTVAYLLMLLTAGVVSLDRQHARAGRHHDLRAGGGGHAAAGGAGLPDPAAERQAADGRAREHALPEHRQLVDHRRS